MQKKNIKRQAPISFFLCQERDRGRKPFEKRIKRAKSKDLPCSWQRMRRDKKIKTILKNNATIHKKWKFFQRKTPILFATKLLFSGQFRCAPSDGWGRSELVMSSRLEVLYYTGHHNTLPNYIFLSLVSFFL